METFVELRAVITEFQAKMAEARGEMSKTESHGSSKFGGLQKYAGAALLGVGAAAVGIAAASAKMASDLEDANARLATAVKQAGGSMQAYAGQISRADRSMEKFGFTNAQTNTALAAGVVATGSTKKALDLLALAADLAAFKHVDLSTAMTAVAKASEGQLRPLKQLGIDLPVAAGGAEKMKVAQAAVAKAQAAVNAILAKTPGAADAASKAHAAYEAALVRVKDAQAKLNDVSNTGATVIDALRQRLGGQAATAADTFGGKLQAAKAKTEDMLAALGTKLIPVLETLVSWTLNAANAVGKLIGWFEKHRTATILLAGAIAGPLVAAFLLWLPELITAAISVVAIYAPIAALIIVAAALGAGIAYLATHWHQVWSDIKQWTGDAYQFIHDHWYLLMAIPLVGWMLALAMHWHDVWVGMQQIAGAVVSFIIRDVFKPMVDEFLFFVSVMVDGAAKAFGWVPGIGGKLKAAKKEFEQFRTDTNNTMNGWATDASRWGQTFGINLTGGLGRGLVANIQQVYGVAQSIAANVATAMRKGAQVSSPSRLTMEVGHQLMVGLETGMARRTAETVRMASATAAMVGGAFDVSPGTTGSGGGSRVASQVGGDLVVNIDGQQLFRITQQQLLRAQRNGTLGIRAT